MGKKYRLKKKYSISVFTILIMIIVMIVFINIGYSIWNSRLNISGKVTLDYDPPDLKISVSKISDNVYTSMSEETLNNGSLEFVSDELSTNSLTTTLKVKDASVAESYLSINFNFVNENENLSTNGKVEEFEYVNTGNVIKNISKSVTPTTISSGELATFNFSADINTANLSSTVYYTYAIIYEVNDIDSYFYYTIKILPE